MEGEDPIRQYLADLRTQRKRHLLDFNGRDYLVDKFTDNGAAYYKCRECKRGRVTSLPDGSVEETKPCNDSCIPLSLEQRLCEVAKEKACRICAERTTLTPQECYNIVRNELYQLHPAAIAFFPLFTGLKGRMKYARKKNLPRIPTSYSTIPPVEEFLPSYLLDYSLQNRFLCLNHVYFPEDWHAPLVPLRIIGFMSVGSISKLANAEKIFIDGTFKVCPVPFMQLLIISTMRGAEDKCKIIPRLYVLLPSKSEHCYCAFFDCLFNMLHNDHNIPRQNIRWRNVSLDFETGLIAAFKNFVSTNDNQLILEGCNFHFAQCLHRKLTSPEIGLAAEYNRDDSALKGFV